MTAAAPMRQTIQNLHLRAASEGVGGRRRQLVLLWWRRLQRNKYLEEKDSEWFYLDENGDLAVSQRIDEYYVNSQAAW